MKIYSPEFELLLLSLRPADEESAVRQAREITAANDINWEELYTRAHIHCIKPQLALFAGRISSDVIPADFTDRLNEAYRDNLVNQIRYADEFFRIRDLFAVAEISIIPFKGFWLAHEAYGDIAARESLDVDVFTDELQLEKIRELMTGAGYSEEAAYHGLTFSRIRKNFQEYTFEKIEGGVSTFRIEFHWGICPPEYLMAVRLEDLSDQVTTGTFQGRELEVFSPSAQLLLTLLHHGGKDRFTLLKQVNDIAMIIKSIRGIDWGWLLKVIRRYNAEPLVYTGLNLAASVAGIDLPHELEERAGSHGTSRLAENRLKIMALPPQRWHTPGFNLGNWLFRMRSRTGLVNRLRLTAATVRAVIAGRGMG